MPRLAAHSERRFADRTAVVTGAARGIGRASATRLAAEGAAVALLDLDGDELARTVSALRAEGHDVDGLVVDVADEAALGRALEAVVQRRGRVDVLHAHAGILLPARIEDESSERWNRTLAVNVGGPFLACRWLIPHMQAAGGGAIVLTGSTSGIVADPAYFAYCTSKAAVNHMARQLALDQAAHNIRVNAVCPGWVDTDFNEPMRQTMTPQEIDDAVRASVPLGRQATAEEVAAAVAFLASDDASYITGHCLVVDGGYSIH